MLPHRTSSVAWCTEKWTMADKCQETKVCGLLKNDWDLGGQWTRGKESGTELGKPESTKQFTRMEWGLSRRWERDDNSWYCLSACADWAEQDGRTDSPSWVRLRCCWRTRVAPPKWEQLAMRKSLTLQYCIVWPLIRPTWSNPIRHKVVFPPPPPPTTTTTTTALSTAVGEARRGEALAVADYAKLGIH